MHLARQYPVRGCVGFSGGRFRPAGQVDVLKVASWWCWLLIVLTGMSGSSPGFGQTQDATLAPHKFLFVIETSRTMKPRIAGMAAVAKDLLDSKFHGQMRSNDLVGVWTYDQDLRTNVVPFQELSPGTAVGVLNTIIGGGFEKRADPSVVWRSVARQLVLTPKLTLILISSGEGELTGTTRDQEVNEAWAQWRLTQQKARQPVLTLLRSRGGKVTDWSVTPGPWPIQLPALPPEPVITAAPETVPQPAITNLALTPKPTNAPVRVAEQPRPGSATNLSTSLTTPIPVISPASNPPVKIQPAAVSATGTNSGGRTVATTNEVAKPTPRLVAVAGDPRVTNSSTALGAATTQAKPKMPTNSAPAIATNLAVGKSPSNAPANEKPVAIFAPKTNGEVKSTPRGSNETATALLKPPPRASTLHATNFVRAPDSFPVNTKPGAATSAMVPSQPQAAVPSGTGSVAKPAPEKHPTAPSQADWSAVRTPETASATQSVILPAKAPKRTFVDTPPVNATEVAEAVGGPAATQDASGSEVVGGGESLPVGEAQAARPIPGARNTLSLAAVGVLGLCAVLCFGLWIRSFRRG